MVDLPEPLRPVMTTILSRGIASEIFLRLCSRAPWMAMERLRWPKIFRGTQCPARSVRRLAERLFSSAQERFVVVRQIVAERSFRRSAETAREARALPSWRRYWPVWEHSFRHFFRRAARDDLTAFFATFGTEIDDPVGAFDDFEIVLDDDDRMPGIHQALKQPNEKRDVVEMQTGGWFVEDKQIAAFAVLGPAFRCLTSLSRCDSPPESVLSG